MSTESKITFITNKICPYAHRAWIALNAKGLNYELKEVDLVDKPAEFTTYYRKAIGHDRASDGKVPIVCFGDDLVLTESAILVEYLDRAFPSSGHKLFSDNPLVVYKGRIFLDYIGPKFFSHAYAVFGSLTDASQDGTKSAALPNIYAGLRYLEDLIDGPFIGGEEWGFAEVCAYTFFAPERIHALTLRGFSWEEANTPKLKGMIDRLAEIPAFKATHQSNEDFLAQLKDVYSRRQAKAAAAAAGSK